MYFPSHLSTCIMFMTISTILSKPTFINLDTTLRLETSTSATRKTPKHNLIESLDLTLTPPSGITTRNEPPKKISLPEALGIKKKPLFKKSLMKQQSFRLNKPDDMWSEHQTGQLEKHMTYQSHIQQNSITYRNLEGEDLRDTTLACHPQGSVPNTQPNNLVMAQDLNKYNPLEVNPNQGPISHGSIVDSPMKAQFNPLKSNELSSKVHHTQERGVQVKMEPASPISMEELNLNPFNFKAKTTLFPNDLGIIHAQKKDVSRWTVLGKEETEAHPGTLIDIVLWLHEMMATLTKKLENYCDIEIQKSDLARALRRAKYKLIPSLLGFMMETIDLKGTGNHEVILSEGWQFLKNHMANWKNVDLFKVSYFLKLPIRECTQGNSPEHVLAYLMHIKTRTVVCFKVMSSFISSWKSLKGI